MLKDAKIVMQSRSANSVIVGKPTGLGGPVPNSCANLRSFIRQRPIFAALLAANFSGPAVTRFAGRDVRVPVTVSSVLAVRYVPP